MRYWLLQSWGNPTGVVGNVLYAKIGGETLAVALADRNNEQVIRFDYDANGSITGKPTAISDATQYQVTAQNTSGTSTTLVVVKVK